MSIQPEIPEGLSSEPVPAVPVHAAPKHWADRLRPEPECSVRSAYQRDIDRIIHAKSFRRLSHKTQVFLNPEGDHYRTRMTHTLEVTRIARTMARALSLDEDLTEAIGLGHDLGHTPFGHAGEKALRQLMPGGFSHNEQSLRVVDVLERSHQGLNLTLAVRNGILRHTAGTPAFSLEGQLVHRADRIAYLVSDLDDALRAGIIRDSEIPKTLNTLLGRTPGTRIDVLVKDIISVSRARGVVRSSPDYEQAMRDLWDFLLARVYLNPVAKGEETKAQDILLRLFAYYVKHLDELPDESLHRVEIDGAERVVCDYVAGMTDRYAVTRFEGLFIPKSWKLS